MSSTLISWPDQIYPLKGELYRLIYRFSSNELGSTWPNAIALQVDNHPWFGVRGATFVPDRSSMVVDVEIVALPTTGAAPVLEDMLSAVRQFSFSGGVIADIVAVYAITDATSRSATLQRQEDAAKVLTTSWGSPAPESVDPETAPGVLAAATAALFGSVRDFVTGSARFFGDTTKELVSPVVGSIATPSVTIGLIAIAVIVFIVYTKGGK